MIFSTNQQQQRGLMERAKRGSPDALNDLALCYLEGKNDVSIDQKKAFDLFQQAADKNFVRAYYNLGLLYEKGWGVEQDYVKAVENYRLASDANLPLAQYNLSLLVLSGLGTDRNPEEAFALCTKAANHEQFAQAICNLGWFYLEGIGVEKDETKASELFYKALDLNLPEAALMVGECYQRGVAGHAASADNAVRCYEAAANAGNTRAMYQAGLLYWDEAEALHDKAKAMEWIEKAADGGYELAKQFLTHQKEEDGGSEGGDDGNLTFSATIGVEK